ncbi:MAG: hydrogenase, partial [Phycisphaerae bacterium]|nr:hydrogenase [Phycisphaerae bacterium]
MSPVNPLPTQPASGGCASRASEAEAPASVKRGLEYWRSLEQHADGAEFREFMHREFPEGADRLEGDDRRQFLRVMGASFALAGVGLAGCRRLPESTIVPFAASAADRVPGIPVHYASSMELCGVGAGLLVKSYDGRPIKIEGNPDHPTTLGGCDSFAQASVLELYDPDRSRLLLCEGVPVGDGAFAEFSAFVTERFGGLAAKGGEGLAVLSESFGGPSMADLRSRFARRYPNARWVEWEPFDDDAVRGGTAAAFGRPMRPDYRFDLAKVVVSLDADFFRAPPASLKWTRDYARSRRITSADPATQEVSRLYAFEPCLSLVGANADERVPVRAGDVAAVAAMLAARCGVQASDPRLRDALAALGGSPAASRLDAHDLEVLDAAAEDLKKNQGGSIVVAGPNQPAAVHALVALLNERLG